MWVEMQNEEVWGLVKTEGKMSLANHGRKRRGVCFLLGLFWCLMHNATILEFFK